MIVMEGAIRRQLLAVVYVGINFIPLSGDVGRVLRATAKLQQKKQDTQGKSNEA
jgi:hypothetical protein